MAWAFLKNKYRYCHSCRYSPWIFIDVGTRVETGSGLPSRGAELPGDAIAGWTVTSVTPEGRIGLGAMRRGADHPMFVEIDADALLLNNPRLLVGRRVRHPHPPSTSPAAGWVVKAIDEPSATVSLEREHVRSSAPVEEVVRHNIEELRTRIVVLPEEWD
jgi:hypothetical protein